jgi:hypothetical protein
VKALRIARLSVLGVLCCALLALAGARIFGASPSPQRIGPAVLPNVLSMPKAARAVPINFVPRVPRSEAVALAEGFLRQEYPGVSSLAVVEAQVVTRSEAELELGTASPDIPAYMWRVQFHGLITLPSGTQYPYAAVFINATATGASTVAVHLGTSLLH